MKEDINEILDKMFYPDISGIIKSYLFVKCSYCEEDELESYSFEMYNGNWICIDCRCKYRRNIRLCDECIRLYDLREPHNACPVCFNTCHTFCKSCAENIYDEDNIINTLQHLDDYLTNNDTRELITNLLDEMLINVAEMVDIDEEGI